MTWCRCTGPWTGQFLFCHQLVDLKWVVKHCTACKLKSNAVVSRRRMQDELEMKKTASSQQCLVNPGICAGKKTGWFNRAGYPGKKCHFIPNFSLRRVWPTLSLMVILSSVYDLENRFPLVNNNWPCQLGKRPLRIQEISQICISPVLL